MRLLILSDLHLESSGAYAVPAGAEYEAVVLAGDIHTPGVKGVEWAAQAFGGKPVVYVPGNHEFYGKELHLQLDGMHEAAEGTNVHVLSRDSVVIDGVHFLGATLWTDFALPVANQRDLVSHYEQTDIARALEVANREVMDFRLIQLLAPASVNEERQAWRRLLRAEDTLAMHWIDRDWLRRELEEGSVGPAPTGPTVVVTHHAPSRKSVAKRYANDWCTPAFVSDLPRTPFFESEPMRIQGRKVATGDPALWVHGHTHSAFDYQVGGCRVVSNPRGYRLRDSSFENGLFNPAFVVSV